MIADVTPAPNGQSVPMRLVIVILVHRDLVDEPVEERVPHGRNLIGSSGRLPGRLAPSLDEETIKVLVDELAAAGLLDDSPEYLQSLHAAEAARNAPQPSVQLRF